MSPARRALIVGAYFAAFWIALPAALWAAGGAIDDATGWEGTRWPWLGATLVVTGLGWLGWSIAALWTEGHGLPITALPPPKLARRGPYAVSRHPIYVGFHAALLGAALWSGSAGLLWVVTPAFLPLWAAYAKLEERGLERRFGRDYRRYRRLVPFFPRPWVYSLLRLLGAAGALPHTVVGREHLPRGPAVLVSNHASYLDFWFVACATWRPVRYLVTAEVFRKRAGAWAMTAVGSIPVRRYRVDPRACREMLRLLADGEYVGVHPESERSVLGDHLGALPDVAGVLSRLRVPVVPVGLSYGYEVGPRWSDAIRRRPVKVRIGPPIRFGDDPRRDLDEAIGALLDADPQPVHLEGLDRGKLGRALWRCPRCLGEDGWRPDDLACACGARWTPRPDGRFDGEGAPVTLGDLGRRVWAAPEPGPIEVAATCWRERDPYGPIAPLERVGEGVLRIGPDGLAHGDLRVPLSAIRTTSTERADTLQVATVDAMWQFRLAAGSAFRLQRSLDRWRGALRDPAPRPPRHAPCGPAPWRWPLAGAALGLGLLVAESALLVRPLMDGFGAGGIAAPLLAAGAAYVALGAALDLGTQAATRRAWAPGPVRALVPATAALIVGLASGQHALAVLAQVGVALAWTAAVHVPHTAPFAAVFALWALWPALPQAAPPGVALGPAAAGPSFAVVVLDTVRLDRTSLARSDRDTTPHLAALAARGTRFDRARSPSCWSLPAHASLLTGWRPARHGADYEHLRLDPSVPYVPEILARAGWETAAFSANPLVAPGTGMGRGFLRFEEPWRSYTLREALFAHRVATRFGAADRDKGGAEVVAGLERWMASRDGSRPFFALVNLMEAHVPYQEVPVAWRTRWASAPPRELERVGQISELAQVFGTAVPQADRALTLDLLDGATAAADAWLGRVLAALGDDVVVFVVSDHGELLGEHGLWGHSTGLWEPLLRVPLVVAGPGFPAGTASDAPVTLEDVAATVLAMAGRPAPPDGRDLRGAIAPDRVLRAEHGRTAFFTAAWGLSGRGDLPRVRGRQAAAVRGATKRIVTESGADEGYDLAVDPGEAAPFAGATTALAVSLPRPGAPVDLPDTATREALRALGYVE